LTPSFIRHHLSPGPSRLPPPRPGPARRSAEADKHKAAGSPYRGAPYAIDQCASRRSKIPALGHVALEYGAKYEAHRDQFSWDEVEDTAFQNCECLVRVRDLRPAGQALRESVIRQRIARSLGTHLPDQRTDDILDVSGIGGGCASGRRRPQFRTQSHEAGVADVLPLSIQVEVTLRLLAPFRSAPPGNESTIWSRTVATR
jgi:hypothetical protein